MAAGRKPRTSGRGKPGSCLSLMPLLLDVLPNDAQRRATAGCGEGARGPEMPVHPVPVCAAGELRSQTAGRHAFEAVYQPGHWDLRRVFNEQVHVIVSPSNSRNSAPKSAQTFRMASSQQRSVSASSTPHRYFVTKTK